MHTQIRCPSYSRFSLRGLASIAVAGLSMFGSHPAAAAKVYRCGNVFQDQPCTSDARSADAKPVERPAEKSKAVEPAAPVAAEPARPAQEVTKLAVRASKN